MRCLRTLSSIPKQHKTVTLSAARFGLAADSGQGWNPKAAWLGVPDTYRIEIGGNRVDGGRSAPFDAHTDAFGRDHIREIELRLTTAVRQKTGDPIEVVLDRDPSLTAEERNDPDTVLATMLGERWRAQLAVEGTTVASVYVNEGEVLDVASPSATNALLRSYGYLAGLALAISLVVWTVWKK